MQAATLEAGTAETPTDLEARLVAWMVANKIKGHYSRAGIAARLIREIHASHLERWLDLGGTQYLRHACMSIKDYNDLSDAEVCAELRGSIRRQA